MASVLLVDDNPALIQEQLAHIFSGAGHQIGVALTGQDGVRQAEGRTPDVILLDLRLPDLSGLDVYQRLRQVDARIPVIFITDATNADSAIEAMKQGAYDYLSKPVDLRRLRLVLGQALELSRLAREPAEVAETPPHDDRGDSIIGRCPAMIEVYKAIGRVAAQDVTVLITGESGTGKELVARAIYQHSARALAPFLAINCAAIPEQLQESELFGHEKGAFTGADRKRIGKFEQCNGGTIFLDEVGDMPLATQAKMLRLLQEQTFERVGGNETVRTDVRLIAATNHNLDALASAERYRLDLIYRLSGFTIHLPPLRERGEDFPLLVEHYMRRFNRQLGRELREISPGAMKKLRQYSWPGNIRELQSILKQAMLRSVGPVLVPEFLPDLNPPTLPTAADDAAGDDDEVESRLEDWIEQRIQAGGGEGGDLYQEVHQQVDRFLLARVLRRTDGNQLQAVRILGIAPRTLRLKLRELGLSITRSVAESKEEPA